MANTYRTTGRLTNPVTDLAAAREYLDEPMVDYIDKDLVPVVHDIKWDLTSTEAWQVEVITHRALTEDEAKRLSEWISGQNSDGLGEGFEQQPFAEHEEYDEYGSPDEDSYCMSSFDWEVNDCKLTLIK